MEVTFSGLESWLGAAVFLIVSHLEVSSIHPVPTGDANVDGSCKV